VRPRGLPDVRSTFPVARSAAEIFLAHPRLTSKRLASWDSLPSPRWCAVSSFLRRSFEYGLATLWRRKNRQSSLYYIRK
jgi:hypothetical protein